ncbi:MAG: PilZ domain-containing protein [Vulcanimicrobiota bacterium]
MLEVRRARRRECRKNIACELSGKVFVACLRDISWLGARLSGQDLPEVGTLLRLAPVVESLTRSWVFAQVCWVRRGDTDEAGLRFLEPPFRLAHSWVAQLAPSDDPAERRKAIRVPTEIHVEVKVDGLRSPLEATSLDLSRDGARLRMPRVLQRGSTAELYLCLPWCLLEVPAQVVRQSGHDRLSHSLKFGRLSPYDQDALAGFLQESL